MKPSLVLCKAVCIGLLLSSPHLYAASDADAAMVTSLQGNVLQDGKAAQAFIKIRQGEVFTLRSGAKVEITYFDSGRQEVWMDDGSFKVGAEKSEAIKGQPARVGKISPILARQLSKTPESATSNSRVGMVRLRATNIIRLKEVEDSYISYKRDQAPGSYTAELYKLNALNEMREYGLMEEFIGNLRGDNPNDPTVAEIAARYLVLISDSKSRLRDVTPSK